MHPNTPRVRPPVTASSGSIAGRSGILLTARVVGSAGFFAAVVVLAHGLDIAGRGAMAFITVSALTASALARFGVGDATVVLAARMSRKSGALCANLLLWTLVSSAAAALMVSSALMLAGEHRPAGVAAFEVVVIGAGVVAGSFIEAGYSLLLVSGRVREQALITALGPCLYALLLAVVWAAARGLDTSTAAAVWLVGQLIWAVALVVVAVRAIPPTKPDRLLLVQMLRFGLQAWVGNLAHYLNARVDQLLVGTLASTRSLGLYAVAVNASEIVLYVPIAATQALMSTIAADEPAVRLSRVVRVFRATNLVTAFLVTAGALTGPYLLPIVFGEQYTNSTPAYWVLLLGSFGFAAMTILSSGLLLSGMPRSASVGPTTALLFGVALDLVLIPRFGALGAAVAATAALLLGGATSTFILCRRLGVALSTLLPRMHDFQMLASILPASVVSRPRARSTNEERPQ